MYYTIMPAILEVEMSLTSRLCAAPIFCEIPLTDVCCLELWREEGVNFQCVIN